MKKFLKDNFWVFGIIVLTVFFRFWRIAELPGGLFPDEAANGLDVNSILRGDIAPFYERGNGREALFFYFLSLSVAFFGRGPWQHHIVSAGFGAAAVIAAYFLAKRMFGKRVALFSSFFLAVSSYPVTLSRTAFRANTMPLLATLTLLFLVKFFQNKGRKEKLLSAALAGLSFGFGFYTYISFRMMVPLLFGLAAVLLWDQREGLWKRLKDNRRYLAAFLTFFIMAFSWIGWYFISHPGTFVGRAGQVSIFSQDLNQGDVWGTFLAVFKKTILAFFTEGDLNWRHNISGYPLLSPFLSPLFGAGLIVFTLSILRLIKQSFVRNIQSPVLYQALCGSWFWFMLVPEITTAEGIPHGLRLAGVIPVIFIFAGFALDWLVRKLPEPRFMPSFKTGLLAAFLAGVLIYNFRLYFAVAANSPEYYYSFRSDLTEVTRYLNERNRPRETYLVLDKFSVQTVDYLTTERNQPYILLDPAKSYGVRLKEGDQIIFTQSTIFDHIKFTKHHPEARLTLAKTNQFRQTIMLVYENP